MLSLIVHDPKEGVRHIEDLSQISDLMEAPDTTLWLDALDPTREEMDLLASEFGFHPVAIENYYSPHPRPRVDEYPGYLFLATHFMAYDPKAIEVTPLELDLFMGKDYIVTIHKEDLPFLSQVTRRWMEEPGLFAGGVGMLLYDILDGLVDSYFPVLDEIDLQLDQLEDEIFEKGADHPVERIFRLKRALVFFRRIAAPLRDTINALMRRDQPLLSQRDLAYLRDVYDQTLRIVDMVDTYRDILTSAVDAYLTIVSNQLNSVMKSLTVAATVLISISLVSGIYGMNFPNMPLLHWKHGFTAIMGVMGVITIGLLYYFKRIKWI